MKKYTIGVIGAGMIAEHHIQSFLATGKVNIKWIANAKSDQLFVLADKYQISKTTRNYHDILNDPEVESVIITAPPKYHKEMFIDCVKAGKHVLHEKPAAMNLEEMDEMISVLKAHPKIKACDCSARHSRLQPKFAMVKKIIEEGKLGEIYYIHHNSISRNGRPGIEYHPSAKWFLNKAIAGGGPLFDWGVYDLSFHLGLLNDKPDLKKINSVMLKSGLDSWDPVQNIYDVEEHFAVQMELTEGIRFYWERANHANIEAPNETRIYGTKGGISLAYCSWDSPEITFFDLEDNGKGMGRKQTLMPEMKNHSDAQALADHWLEVLEGKAEPAMPLELARKHLKIIFSCYQKGVE